MNVNGTSPTVTPTSNGGVQLGGNASLQQKDFMQMLLAEVNNQDPLEPQSSTDFVAQLAQITSVENLESLNQSINGMVSSMQYTQAMQATDLVGKTVTVPTSVVDLEDGGVVKGEITLPARADQVRLLVTDSIGQIVGEVDLGSANAGRVNFDTESLDLDAGIYALSAVATAGNEQLKVPVSISGEVEGVVIPGNGMEVELNVAGVGAMPLSQVMKISQ